MAPSVIVFDCDGVLVDSEAIVIEIESELLTEGGFPITADEIAERYVGLSYPDMMRGLQVQFGRPVPASLSQELQEQALLAFEGRLQPVAGIPELLARHRCAPLCRLQQQPPADRPVPRADRAGPPLRPGPPLLGDDGRQRQTRTGPVPPRRRLAGA